MWNERYATDAYVFGTEPARFLRDHAADLTAGDRALFIADGEGRNSVFGAQMGLMATAMDASSVAIDKARRLAETRGVSVAFHEATIESWDWAPDSFDTVIGIFIQFAAPALRRQLFEGIDRTLRPGGLLMLHGYTPKQVEYGTGGPPHAENMYDTALLKDAFGHYAISRLVEYEAELSEGTGHEGRSALIDLIARKPAYPEASP